MKWSFLSTLQCNPCARRVPCVDTHKAGNCRNPGRVVVGHHAYCLFLGGFDQSAAIPVVATVRQRTYNRISLMYLAHSRRSPPVSYTHLTLPTNREV